MVSAIGNTLPEDHEACYDMSGAIAGVPHQCVCSEDFCSEDSCSSAGGSWTTGCSSCNCHGVEVEPEAVQNDRIGEGCYRGIECDCDPNFCTQSTCETDGGIWSNQCRTCQCDENELDPFGSISSSTLNNISRESVKNGFCDYGYGECEGDLKGECCALEKTECGDSNESIFMSSRQIESASEGHGGACLLQESVREKPLGECSIVSKASTVETICSPNKASCETRGEFFEVEAGSSDKMCKVENTLFGRCGDRCSWSPDDCNGSEKWTFPSEECACEKFRVGGCQKDGNTFCAVSKDACDDSSEWLSPLDVTKESNIECFLCNELGKGGTTYTGSSTTISSSKQGSDQISQNEGQNTIVLVAGIVGALLAAFCIVIFCSVCKSSNKEKEVLPKPFEPPIFEIEHSHTSNNTSTQ